MMTKHLLLPLLLASLSLGCASKQREPDVRLGIDVLRAQNFAPLEGKRVGIIVNPASVDADRQPTVNVLLAAPNVKITALFGPEHGVWGDEYAGDKIQDKVDPTTGLKAFSLYGKTRKPTKEMLADVDVLVFDLQDIGSRSYTYISSMKAVMEACAEQDKELIILDRPNPLGGERIEGCGVSKGLESFVSYLDVPYLHGMTMGELALMVREESLPHFQKLTVIQMNGWRRDMTWEETGLDWIPTSPHVPHVSTIAAYAATGILGELYQVSNGVGYTQPFEVVGSPKVDGVALAEKLNRIWPDERGIYFRPIRFKPFYATNKGEVCQGVQVHIDPRTAPSLLEINYRIVEALDGVKMMTLANTPKPSTRPATQPAKPTTRNADDPLYAELGDQLVSGPATAPAAGPATAPATAPAEVLAVSPLGRRDMFDKVTGSKSAGNVLTRGDDLAPLFAQWRADADAFRHRRAKYLLYR